MKFLLAVLLATSSALAAPGDVEAILRTPDKTLDAAELAKYKAAVRGTFPEVGAQAEGVIRYYCRSYWWTDYEDPENPVEKQDLACNVEYTIVQDKTAFLEARIAGMATRPYVVDGDNVTYKKYVEAVPSQAGKTLFRVFYVDAFTGLALTDLHDFVCKPEGADIVCFTNYLDTVTPDNFITLDADGYVVIVLGREA